MSATGRVIGGVFLDSTVTTATFGSDLVIQAGFKGSRKLNAETVTSWAEIPTEARIGAFQAMGKAAAGVALPGRFGKAASAAVGAAFDSKRPIHQVRVDWLDGKQSLLQLPEALFKHLELVLASRRVAPPESTEIVSAAREETQPSISDKAFDLVSGLVKDRFPARNASPEQSPEGGVPREDIIDQLQKLASLRDAGVISEVEFAAKKAELLARL